MQFCSLFTRLQAFYFNKCFCIFYIVVRSLCFIYTVIRTFYSCRNRDRYCISTISVVVWFDILQILPLLFFAGIFHLHFEFRAGKQFRLCIFCIVVAQFRKFKLCRLISVCHCDSHICFCGACFRYGRYRNWIIRISIGVFFS